MSLNVYNGIRIAIAAILGGMVSFSVAKGDYIIPIVAVITALVFLAAMKRKVKGVINDERDYFVAGNAARWTLSIYAILSAMGSVILMSLKESDPSFELLGSTLAYSACFILLLNSALFAIFSKKDDAKNKIDDKN